MSPLSLRPLPIVFLLGLLFAGPVACNASPDKRLLQYLNTDGFGNRYVGNAEEENYVALGDTVRIDDKLNPEDFQGVGGKVQIDGTILLPELGAVVVAGYTRAELEAYLTALYSPYYQENDFTVDIQTKGKRYFIFGEVRNEGETNFPGDVTIFEAVMGAQPNDNTANLGRVKLIRADPDDPAIWRVNIGEILDTGDSTFNIHVQEGDIIYVPPTLLGQLGYFLDDLLFPIKQVLSGIGGAIFGSWFGIPVGFFRYGGGGGQGRRGRGAGGGGGGGIF